MSIGGAHPPILRRTCPKFSREQAGWFSAYPNAFELGNRPERQPFASGLPGVIQMLGQARQTGALHINAADTDGIIFFEGGEIFHAECGTFFGDEAVTQIVKTCQGAMTGVYKFVYGATAAQRTVLRSATDLLIDAMREFDESERDQNGEGVAMSDTHNFTAARTPTVYFIDDSATMREVIKIAFRKENIHVITCPDAASALSQFSERCARCRHHRRNHAGQRRLRSVPIHQTARTVLPHARNSDVGRGQSLRCGKSDGGEGG